MTSYLTNPSFENGHHHQDGVPELVVPDGWHLDFLDGMTFPGIGQPLAYRPESVVWNITDAPEHERGIFFLDGQYCLKVFKADTPVYFVLSQHVTGLAAGTRYRFTAPVFPDIIDHYSGSKKVYASDAWAAEARAGWSAPSESWSWGQIPPEEDDITWSDWHNETAGTMEFGHYGDVVVEFTAPASGEVRVWLECKGKWGIENNWFFDAFRLEAVDGEPEPPPPEPEPPPPSGRGQPRVQYERTYVLLHPDADEEWPHSVIDASWRDRRYTLGGSADDAGLGDLDKRNILAVNPDEWGDDLAAFFEQYYPGVAYLPVTASTPQELRDKLAGGLTPVPGPPPEPPPTPTGGEVISVHVQQWPSDGSLDYFIERVKPNGVKLVLNMEDARRVKELSPNTAVVYRQWAQNQDEYWKHPDGPDAGARAYLETFLDSLRHNADVVDYVESLNETVARGDLEGIDRTVAFDVAFCEALAAEGYPARPVVLTAPVGNPEHGTETAMLTLAAKAAQQAGGAVGYHSYWAVDPDSNWCSLDDDFEHYAGRALESWDSTFAAAGVAPRYIFGEGGAVAISSPGGHMNAGAGWRHDSCLNGDWDAYVAQILQFRQKVLAWNAEHDGRCLGVTLFTCKGGDSWRYFELSDKLRALADVLTS